MEREKEAIFWVTTTTT